MLSQEQELILSEYSGLYDIVVPQFRLKAKERYKIEAKDAVHRRLYNLHCSSFIVHYFK